ncbi:MAG: hypothetical protein HYZ31_00460, partial [Gammaproteobacteria bacterium]|nr:hypothetical protein [Gammaproteobacteria bacterium]
PTLEAPAQGEYRDPMEMLRIKLPAKLPIEVLQTLALELDNIDVTAMVSRNGDYAELTPLQPMPWGTHTLRLVEYTADGSINEKAYWEFQVRRSSAFREVDYAASINLIASQRIDDKNLTPPEPNEFTGQGSAIFQGRVADDDWEVSGQMDLLYNSEIQRPEHDLDLGSYLISGRKADNQMNLGHHTLSQTSLIMEGFNRRGLSASTRFDALNSAATGFVMRPDVVLGFRQGLGLSDSANRVSGVTWETQPLQNPEALYVSATYLTGEQTLSGATVGSNINNQTGDAMSLVADSTIMDRRLRVRGEVAASKVSIDYTDPLATDITDENNNAMSLLTTWTPFAVPGQTFFWNTGIEASQVDTYFASLANPTLPSDKKLSRLFFNTDWSGISAQLSTAIETNNVNNNATLPVIETRVNQALLNYVFNRSPDENSWVNWLGIPSLSLQWRGMTQDQIEEAVPNIYQDMDLDTDITQVSNNFSYNTWNWGWLYGESEQVDHINVLEQLTYNRGINANFRIGEHISVMPSLQQQTTQFSFDGSESDTRIVSLSSQFLMQDAWNGSLMFNQAQTESNSTLPQDSTTSTVALQLTWNWILPKNKHPGFDVILSGSWQKLEDAITPVNDQESYQVFLSLAMKLPISSAQ